MKHTIQRKLNPSELKRITGGFGAFPSQAVTLLLLSMGGCNIKHNKAETEILLHEKYPHET